MENKIPIQLSKEIRLTQMVNPRSAARNYRNSVTIPQRKHYQVLPFSSTIITVQE